jgi:hypothetical protein
MPYEELFRLQQKFSHVIDHMPDTAKITTLIFSVSGFSSPNIANYSRDVE